jgi:hypothetical protein
MNKLGQWKKETLIMIAQLAVDKWENMNQRINPYAVCQVLNYSFCLNGVGPYNQACPTKDSQRPFIIEKTGWKKGKKYKFGNSRTDDTIWPPYETMMKQAKITKKSDRLKYDTTMVDTGNISELKSRKKNRR